MNTTICRWQEIDMGHRVVEQGGKCENLHGHRYRIEWHATADALDDKGMIIDFGVIKSTVCKHIEEEFDHKMVLWDQDPILTLLPRRVLESFGVRKISQNPTAENLATMWMSMANYELIMTDCPVRISKVVVHETGKCSAEVSL